MKKFIMAAAAITLLMTTAVLTSCTDNTDDNATPQPTEQPATPTEDALAVKYDGNYVVYDDLNDGIAAALQRRLQGSMTSPTDADCFVINPTGLGQLDMSVDEWKNLIRRTYAGEASLVLTQCSFINFYNIFTAYFSTLLYMEQENYQGDSDAEAQARAQVSQRMANIVRNAYMAGGQADDAVTRGTEVNGQELDWEHIDQWPTEKQMATMFDAYAFSGGNEIYVLNADASKYLNEEVPAQPGNDYEWGQKADAIADWLNRQRKDDAESRSGLADFSRAVTRAGGSTAISDLMNAQTKEFVFDYKYYNPKVLTACVFFSAIKVQYIAYSAYNFDGNVEYYQVRQNITVLNNKTYFPEDEDGYGWWSSGGEFARGAWMKNIETKMWLEGSGTKSVVSAAPLNENGTSSGSSSSGGGTTHTEGGSEGFSIGGGIGASGKSPTFSISGSYSHTKTYSDATSTTWNTTTNWSTKDLTTTFTQENDANGTVTWEHTASNKYSHEDLYATGMQKKKLLTGTCVTDEQVLWKINNPSGIYRLWTYFNVENTTVASINHQVKSLKWFTENSYNTISFDLIAPNRFKQKWNNVIYDYGSITGDIQLTHYLDEYIESAYGNNSANFCWAGLFTSTEATADGSDNARAVFQTFKNSITGMKVQLYQKGFRGQLVFGLKRDGETKLIDKIVLDMDDLYNVGETLTEEVNGYELTFKVTKKNEEVELSKIPWNFSGSLDIPETVYGSMLTVTSLGKNCAQNYSGITAVTIPGTVHTIENSAMSGLYITEINIPEGVQTIGIWSFALEKKLKKVCLPSTLTKIMASAFYMCDAITEIHIKATTPPAMGRDVFEPCYNDAVLYVPKGCKDAYAGAEEWSRFKNIVER